MCIFEIMSGFSSRQAFDSFERDFTISMDELMIRTTQLQYEQNSRNEGSMVLNT